MFENIFKNSKIVNNFNIDPRNVLDSKNIFTF